MSIIGLDGRPLIGADGGMLKPATLTREVDVPTVSGVRQLFGEFVAPSLMPGRLSAILRAAAEGDLRDFLTLAEEMEERELQYASVLGTRKRSITGIDPVLKARYGQQVDDTLADAIREDILDQEWFTDLIDDALDALGKGYAACELIWATAASRWRVVRVKRHDQRLFQFDKATLTELRFRADAEPDGQRLDPLKWVIHTPRLKSGLPARNGLARLAAYVFMLKSFTLKDWATFLEVYGLPLRLGKYGQGASTEDKGVLLRAVRDLGSDAAAIIPATMEIEFVESKGFSEKPFEGMADYLDKQLSKAIIGQTMTTDAGGSRAQAEVHDTVRTDIKKADADQLAATLNRMLIDPYLAVNFGPNAVGSVRLALPVRVPRDIKALSDALGRLVPLGLKVRQDEVRETLGLTDPDEGDEVLSAPAKPEAPPPLEPAVNRRLDPRACPSCSTAANASEADEVDELVDDLLGDWEPDLQPIVKAVSEAANRATTYRQFEEELARLAPDLPITRLARKIAVGTLIGRIGTDPA
jgi:phage gp29-like protein